MLVCPVCRGVGSEDAAECSECGADLTPRWMSSRSRRQAESSVSLTLQVHRSWPRWMRLTLIGSLVWMSALGLYVASLESHSVGPETRLQQLADDVGRLVDSGQTDAVRTVVETARVESQCGWVWIFVLPAPQPGTGSTGLGGGAPSSPEQQVQKEYRPDATAVAPAAAGQQVVVAAGWACR